MRKISTKVSQLEDKPRKLELKNSHNEYYLPHPQIRIIKTPVKEILLDQQKDKILIKLMRKTSQCAPLRTFSIAQLKSDAQNQSKQQDSTPQNKSNLGKKVESRKIRSTSNSETPIRSISKSGLKLQLNSFKKDGLSKRLNLKIEAPTIKKNQKNNLHQTNFDSYYNNEGPNAQLKTVRVQRRNEVNSSSSPSKSEFGQVFNRCKKLIQDYQQKLQSAKKENKMLKQQNERLRQQKDFIRRDNRELDQKE